MQAFRSPKIDDYFQQFTQATEKFERLIESITEEQFNWKPAKKKWSIAECIGHLNITANVYFPLMKSAIKKGHAQKVLGSEVTGNGTRFGRILLWGLNPRRQLKIPAPSKFRPQQKKYPLGQTADKFRGVQEEFVDLLKQSDGLNIGKIRHSTPIPLTRITLDQAFNVLSTHEHRHLKQAEKIHHLMG